jgi:nitrogen fixation/metabolism regulation signal transduction histidine kinase
MDIVSGFVIAGIGLAFLLSSLSITDLLGERLPPWLLPMALSGITVVAGLLLSLKSWRSTPAVDIKVEWPDRSSFLFLLVFVAVTVLYLMLIGVIGMPLATGCYVTATVWQLNKRIVQALIVAAITAIIVHYVFSIGLEMNFPSGVFGK